MFLFKRRPKIGGLIAFHGIEKWWLKSFTEQERNYISDIYMPMGETNKNSLTDGKARQNRGQFHEDNFSTLLSSIPSYLRAPKDRPLQRKYLESALPLARNPMTEHFLLIALIENYYSDREDPAALSKAGELCERDIKLAPAFKSAWFKKFPNDKNEEGEVCLAIQDLSSCR
jgi:hypothetical protein